MGLGQIRLVISLDVWLVGLNNLRLLLEFNKLFSPTMVKFTSTSWSDLYWSINRFLCDPILVIQALSVLCQGVRRQRPFVGEWDQCGPLDTWGWWGMAGGDFHKQCPKNIEMDEFLKWREYTTDCYQAWSLAIIMDLDSPTSRLGWDKVLLHLQNSPCTSSFPK